MTAAGSDRATQVWFATVPPLEGDEGCWKFWQKSSNCKHGLERVGTTDPVLVCPDNYPQEKFTQRTSSLFLNLELLWKTIKKKKKVEQSGISFPDTLKNNHCFPSSCAAKSRCESYQALAWSDRSHVNIKAKSHQNQHSPCLQTDLRLQQCQQPTASAKIFAVVASCPCSPKSVSQVRKIKEILSYESQNYLSSGKI